MTTEVITTLDAVRFCERRARHVLAARTVVSGNIALCRKRVTIMHEPKGPQGRQGPLVRARLQFAP